MKKLYFIALLASSILVACGGDDDSNELGNNKENIGNTTVNDNVSELSESEKFFVGTWELSTANSSRFTFFPNKRVVKDGSWRGKWTYNEQTNTLGTTLGSWAFRVLAKGEDFWSCETVSTKKGVNATKGTDTQYFKDYINSVKWHNTESNTLLNVESSDSKQIEYKDCVVKENSMTCKVVIYDKSYRRQAEGRITIKDINTQTPILTVENSYIIMKYFEVGTYIGNWDNN